MLHLKTTDNAGHCPQVPQWKLWGGGHSSPNPPSWAVVCRKAPGTTSWSGQSCFNITSTMGWQRDRQKENNSSGIHTQLSTEFKGKEKQLLQAATQAGTQRSWRDSSLGHELSQPHCKNSAEEIPEEK